MKVASVLLRWYKSFNVNYMNYPDRRSGVEHRPWNRLGRLADDEDAFPFIEIPLEDDITTIVGANESGKSHLLSAISKVLTGRGIPDETGKRGPYSRTDLCHYTSPRSKNAEDWPHVGLQFRSVKQEDLKALGDALGNPSIASKVPTDTYRLSLILAPDNGGTVAHLYLDNDSPVSLDEAKLQAVRTCLPRAEFIKSDLVISNQVPLSSLLAAYGESAEKSVFDYLAAQEVANAIHSMTLAAQNPQVPADFGKTLASWKSTLAGALVNDQEKAELEGLLFKDVIGITGNTLKFVQELPLDDRTHADSLTATWNREIEERLNLSHYWQQDDSFAIRVNFKQGILYFEITDKTGATYTFKERSSGLRYFLSYYIQAKALEMTSRGKNAIILMDEPDSFLSIIGQRNLLAVFESLVRAESSHQSCQLVYTTHSPFLINRNYPRRLRLVRKGDAEEGTQLIESAMLRRYEPVRSALGIDCAQTLFMGATNIVVEGPTDQFLLSELVRQFVTPDNVSELLDLNAIVMVSAESAPSVEKVLVASQWGDEPVPATVVLLDSDGEGDLTKDKITGKNLKPSQTSDPDERRGNKKLIEEQFVLQIGKVLGDPSDSHKVVTTEDTLPSKLYAAAIVRYVNRWYPEKHGAISAKLDESLAKPEFESSGVVAGATVIFNEMIHEQAKAFDKMGVLQEAVALISERAASQTTEWSELEKRLVKLCHEVRRAVSASQQAARRSSGKQAIQRIIDDYFKTHKESSSVFAVQLLLERIQRDTKLLGEDGEKLDGSLNRLLSELNKARAADQQHYRGEAWRRWKTVISAIRKNPLDTAVRITELGPECDGSSVAGQIQLP
ncbi:MAG: AAA family ATPase [Planctomycetales bacterium]|nr:AAA family ATPase [Planctomycetales bacterium]